MLYDTVKVSCRKFKKKHRDIQETEYSHGPTNVDEACLRELVKIHQCLNAPELSCELHKLGTQVHSLGAHELTQA